MLFTIYLVHGKKNNIDTSISNMYYMIVKLAITVDVLYALKTPRILCKNENGDFLKGEKGGVTRFFSDYGYYIYWTFKLIKTKSPQPYGKRPD
jgi:hypothetical protein